MNSCWTWSDRSEWSYDNWRSGEPNEKVRAGERNEFCIEMLQSTEWNDRWCGTPRYFVCKKTIQAEGPTKTANGTTPKPPPTQVKSKPPTQSPITQGPTTQGPTATNDSAPKPAPTKGNPLRLQCQTLINPALNPLCQMLPNDYSQGNN